MRSRSVGSPDATRAVDWEQRIDFPRLRRDRLDRAKAALERQTSARCCCSTRTTSATSRARTSANGRATRTRASRCCRAAATRSSGTSARRPATTSCSRPGSRRRTSAPASRRCAVRCPSRPGSPTGSATRIANELRERGLHDEPLGVDMADLVTLEALQRAGIHVTDGSQVLLEARKIKTPQEIALLDQSAGLVDAVYEEIYRMLRPGVYEHEIVGARAPAAVRDGIGARRGRERGLRRPLQPASARVLRPAAAPGRPGVLRHHPLVHGLPDVLLPHVQRRRRQPVAARRVQALPRMARRRDRARPARHDDRPDRRGLADGEGARLPRRGDVLRPPVRPRHRRRPVRVADDLARALARPPGRARGGDGVRARDVLRRDRRTLGGADRGRGRRDGDRLRGDHALPGRGAARCRTHLRARRRPRSRTAARRRQRRRRGRGRRPSAVVEPAGVLDERDRARASSPTACPATGSSGARTSSSRDALPGPLERPRARAGSSAARSARRTWRSRSCRSATAMSTSTCTRSRRASTCSRVSPCSTSTDAASSSSPARAASYRSACRMPSAARRAARGSRWRRRVRVQTASDTFFLGPPPETPRSTARRPRPAEPQPLPPQRGPAGPRRPEARRSAVGAPTVSASMATAVLAYSGIAVKMLVDQRLDAQLHTMFMVDYQPGAVAHPHDHPFEESYYMLEGEVDVVADGDRYTLRPGDVFWTARRLRPRLLRGARQPRALARDLRARAARPTLVPVRARLGLPRRAARVGGRSRMSHTEAPVLDDFGSTRDIYRRMLLIRGFEDLVQSLFLKGEVYGTTHLYSGQEAVATGVASLLEDRDRVAATYRGHGHALALGVDPQALLDEMLGRATGVNGGRAGSMNVNSPERSADRLVRHRRRKHRRGDRSRARAQADDRWSRGRVLRRRRDEPGLRLRVPQLREGAEAAAGPRLREQRLRRVHGVPRRHGRRDPRASRGDGGSGRDDRRHERVDGPRSGCARDRPRARRARPGLPRGAHLPLRRPLAQRSRAPTGPRASSTSGGRATRSSLLRARLEAEGAEPPTLDQIEHDVRDELDAMRERGLAAPFPSALTVPRVQGMTMAPS